MQNERRGPHVEQAPDHFVEVVASAPVFWRPIENFRAGGRPNFAPLSDTELLAIAHHLPILVTFDRHRAEVVACLDDEMLAIPAFDKGSGRFARPVMLAAVRGLPFRLEPGSEILQLDKRALVAAGRGRSTHQPDGTLEPRVAQIERALRRGAAGRGRLARAAHLLFAAGILAEAPKPSGLAAAGPRLFTVDTEAYAKLSPMQITSLAWEDYLAVDLATSCIFSRQMMRASFRAVLKPGEDVAPGHLSADTVDQLVRNLGQLSFGLEDSPLIDTAELGSESFVDAPQETRDP